MRYWLRRVLCLRRVGIISVVFFTAINSISTVRVAYVRQEPFPDPPSDLTRIYYLTADKQLLPLPFEAGMTSLNVFVPALEDKVTHVRISGATAQAMLTNDNARFFVFVADRMDPPPHQLVRLTSRGANRDLKISVIKDRRGYAPFEEDNIRLERRLLKRMRVQAGANRFLFVNYMQLRPLQPLPPGEYAIIGDSLADMATFRIK
jgi:hypothetical protein